MNEEFTAKKAPVDEMMIPTTDLNPSPVAAQTEDWGMTSPLKKPPDGQTTGGGGGDWKMPEPVFRVSDGFCPLKSGGNVGHSGKKPESIIAAADAPQTDESLANLYAPPEKDAEDGDLSQHTMHNLNLSDLQAEIPELAPASPVIAAAQPNISQEFVITPAAEAPPEKTERSQSMRLVFAALGVLAMLSFAAGFLVLVYYLFFYKPAG